MIQYSIGSLSAQDVDKCIKIYRMGKRIRALVFLFSLSLRPQLRASLPHLSRSSPPSFPVSTKSICTKLIESKALNKRVPKSHRAKYWAGVTKVDGGMRNHD